jgi:hypothetical protein
LQVERQKREIRRRLYGRTRPGTLLRNQIPIKCEHWDVAEAGHLELDTVSHCGGNGEGLFAYSFNLTDIASTWDETRSVLGKGGHGIVQAFSEMCQVLHPWLSVVSSESKTSLLFPAMKARLLRIICAAKLSVMALRWRQISWLPWKDIWQVDGFLTWRW